MSAKKHVFTLGIEEEFAIIDPETRELRSHIHEILEGGKIMLKEQIKPEMHQSVVELGTEICQSIVDARAHVLELRSKLAELAGRSGLKIASVGTHPFSHWHDQLITEFERFPRTGIPDAFESLSEYEDYCKLLVKTGCVDNAKRIWWDIRLHPFFDTLEVRVCDAQSRVDDTLAIAALIQAVIAKLHKLLRQNITFRVYRRRLLDENRWRASRYGIDGKLIDFGKEAEVDTRSLLNELLEFVSTEVSELGSEKEMAHIERIMREGTGADRQLGVWERTHDMKAVVDNIVEETYEGLNLSRQAAIAG